MAAVGQINNECSAINSQRLCAPDRIKQFVSKQFQIANRESIVVLEMMNGLRRGDLDRGERICTIHPTDYLSAQFSLFSNKSNIILGEDGRGWERMDAFLITDLRPQESKY